MVAGSSALPALLSAVPAAVGVRARALVPVLAALHAPGLASGAARSGDNAVIGSASAFASEALAARPRRAVLSGRILPAWRRRAPVFLPARAGAARAPTIEMGNLGYVPRLRAFHSRLCFAVLFGVRSHGLDEGFSPLAGVPAADVWLRDRALPPHGCGHHLPARDGVFAGDGGDGGLVFWPDGAQRRPVSQPHLVHQPQRVDTGHHPDGDSVPAAAQLVSGAAGPAFQPQPAGLSQDARGIRARVYDRAAHGAPARPRGGPLGRGAGRGPHGHFCDGWSGGIA